MTICPRLLKLPEVVALSGLKPTSIYDHAKRGIFPTPIKLTARSSAWVAHEVAEVNRARIAGRSDAEIQKLVTRLLAERVASAA
jgi:prophage regulatory protein